MTVTLLNSFSRVGKSACFGTFPWVRPQIKPPEVQEEPIRGTGDNITSTRTYLVNKLIKNLPVTLPLELRAAAAEVSKKKKQLKK